MFDASAKISSGILSGNINNFGDFDECLSTRSPLSDDARGQYCLTYVNIDIPEEMKQLNRLKKLSHSLETFQSNSINGMDDVNTK